MKPPRGRATYCWSNLWRHFDGVVHAIGQHLPSGHGSSYRAVYAECGAALACIDDRIRSMPYFLQANTSAPYPTCIACWDLSNFGTYAPR